MIFNQMAGKYVQSVRKPIDEEIMSQTNFD